MLTDAEPSETRDATSGNVPEYASGTEAEAPDNVYSEIKGAASNYDQLHPYANSPDDQRPYSRYGKPKEGDVYEIPE
jgi:hypothetical protein